MDCFIIQKNVAGFVKVLKVFELFRSVLRGVRSVGVAYSGGKDSTCAALLLYKWIVEEAGDVEVVLLNSDTLSEIHEMREWTVRFMKQYCEGLASHGVQCSYKVFTPPAIDTFYWRVLIRGYPAPTYSFRWCVNLLKRRPVKEEMRILVLGHRREESQSRLRSLKNLFESSRFIVEEGGTIKIYPLLEWSENEVWSFLRDRGNWGPVNLEELFALYGKGVRYGCWHCTLVKRQLAHYALGGGHLYLEALRLLYRAVSDTPVLRARKHSGYSKMGHLLPPARAVIYHAISVAEKLSRIRLYGLDESRLGDATLRELFYEMDVREADEIIKSIENGNHRFNSLDELKHPRDRSLIVQILNNIESRTRISHPEAGRHLSILVEGVVMALKR